MSSKETCTFPLCAGKVERGGFCIHHAKYFAGPKTAKVKKRIPQQSEKRIKEQPLYVKIVRRKLGNGVKCQVGSPDCTGTAQGLHHITKRSPANLLVEANLLACCTACNNWVEAHPDEAIKKGVSKSKFK